MDRPISDITSHLREIDLRSLAKQTLDTLERKELEVISTTGDWYMVRLAPYRTADNVIKGVVITFTSVTELKLAKEFAENIIATVRQPLLVLDES